MVTSDFWNMAASRMRSKQIRNIALIYGGLIAEIPESYVKSGSTNTSDFRPEVAIWPFCACALKYAIYPLLQEQFGRCAVALKQASRSTECVSSSMKHQLKAPSNRRNFAIYTAIGVMESNADVRIFLPKPPKYTLMRMRSKNVARSRHKCCYIFRILITSCQKIPGIVDNRSCRFWNIFTSLVILCMRRQPHAL